MTKSETYIITLDGIKFEIPYKCPHCNKEMTANIIMQSRPIEIEQIQRIALLAKCNICNNFFALAYLFRYKYGKPETILIPYTYSPTINLDIPDNIKEISKDFEEIYTQSETAYQLNLNQIAGMGYRKSIEFLVKDFLIFLNTDDADRIINLTINKAIAEIDNQKLQNLARMTNYLANDQVHIKTLHPTKDIDDLRDFLKNLVYLISFEISYHDGLDNILSNWSSGSNLPIYLPSVV